MTMFRDTTMLDYNNMHITAAEAMIPHHARMVSREETGWLTWVAIDHRAYWEAGYAAGLQSAQPQPTPATELIDFLAGMESKGATNEPTE